MRAASRCATPPRGARSAHVAGRRGLRRARIEPAKRRPRRTLLVLSGCRARHSCSLGSRLFALGRLRKFFRLSSLCRHHFGPRYVWVGFKVNSRAVSPWRGDPHLFVASRRRLRSPTRSSRRSACLAHFGIGYVLLSDPLPICVQMPEWRSNCRPCDSVGVQSAASTAMN